MNQCQDDCQDSTKEEVKEKGRRDEEEIRPKLKGASL